MSEIKHHVPGRPKGLGLTIPQSVLLWADQVIE